MADYNKNGIFNERAEHGGFFWNGAEYVLVMNLNEIINVSDSINLSLAKLILSETGNVSDSMEHTASLMLNEGISSLDEEKLSTLLSIFDSEGILDGFMSLMVSQYLKEESSFIEEFKQLVEIIQNEDMPFGEKTDLKAFMAQLDNFGLKDLKVGLQTLLSIYDEYGLTDRAPKKAISDFIIGVSNDLDTAYDWLIPFDLKLDWGNTDIQVMPEAELTSIELPGIDGSIVEDTVYKDRLFTIVGYSEQGLTEAEKETLKSKITSVLSTTKSKSKKLVVQDRGIAFDVRYEGNANITEGPSYVKAEIPFRAGPYGYDFFEAELIGRGLIENSGDVPIGVETTIKGPVSYPTFTMGTQTYRYNGTIPSGSSFVLDHGMMTCYIVDSNGKKRNVLANLSGTFQKIPAKTSIVLNATDAISKLMVTTWKNKILW